MSLAALLFLALVLDAVLGEPEWLWSRLPHPAVLMGRLVGWLDSRFNRGTRRKARGIAALVILLLLAALVGSALATLGPVVEVIAVAILIAQKSLVQHVGAVSGALRRDLMEGRKAVAMIVSRDTSEMDESSVSRAAIESAAENLSDGVIAPAFWFLLAGLPGLFIYKIVNTADSMIGYLTPLHRDFGWAAARLDDLLNLIPARLTAALIAITGWCFDARGIAADARLHRSPNAGWPEAAMARALGIALSGPRVYSGTQHLYPWVNETARRVLTTSDIDASLTMLWKAWSAFAALCLVLALFIR